MTARKGWRREAAIEALLIASSIGEAARACHLGEKTLRRWMADATFAAELRAAQRRVFSTGLDALYAALPVAVETLRGLIDRAPDPIRVRAALGLVELALKAHSAIDLEERVQALEREDERRPAPRSPWVRNGDRPA